jgi:hypothetical protein
MIRKILFVIHFAISILLLAIGCGSSIIDIFSVGKSSIGNYFWFTCPSCFAIPIAILSVGYLLKKPRPSIYSLPLIINAFTIIVTMLLFSLDNAYPDIAFQRYFTSYDEVITSVETKEFALMGTGFVSLPEKYREIFKNGVFYSHTDQGTHIFYFEDGNDNLDDISWGYLYQSDGSQPSKADHCYTWRELVPPKPNWVYCKAHALLSRY